MQSFLYTFAEAPTRGNVVCKVRLGTQFMPVVADFHSISIEVSRWGLQAQPEGPINNSVEPPSR